MRKRITVIGTVTALVLLAVLATPFPKSISLSMTGRSLDDDSAEMSVAISGSYWHSLLGYERISGSLSINGAATYYFAADKSNKITKAGGILTIPFARHGSPDTGSLYISEDFKSLVCISEDYALAAPANSMDEAAAVRKSVMSIAP